MFLKKFLKLIFILDNKSTEVFFVNRSFATMVFKNKKFNNIVKKKITLEKDKEKKKTKFKYIAEKISTLQKIQEKKI